MPFEDLGFEDFLELRGTGGQGPRGQQLGGRHRSARGLDQLPTPPLNLKPPTASISIRIARGATAAPFAVQLLCRVGQATLACPARAQYGLKGPATLFEDSSARDSMARKSSRDSLAVESGTAPAHAPERAWADRIRAGDAAAFELAFRTYHAPLCAFAHRYVRSPEVADDLVHDVFTRIWEQRATLEIRDSLKSFLYTAVRNHAIMHVRHALVERRWQERVFQTSAAPADRHGPTEAEARVEAQELTEAVERVLARLPERCRLALTLRWQRQMSYAEVAEVMGVSVKTVEIHVTRGLADLREHYRELLPHR